MARMKETTVLICFEMNGIKMEMTDRAFVEEGFVKGMEETFLQITMDKQAIKKVESAP